MRSHRSPALYLFLAFLVVSPLMGQKGKRMSATLVNETDWDIHYLFLSPAREKNWGPDQLGDVVLRSGMSFTLTKIPCDVYDVKLVDEDQDECVVEEVELCGGDDEWVLTNDVLLACQSETAGLGSLTLYNESDWTIHHVRLSPSTSRRWGPDRLGDQVLGPGEYLTLSSIECDDYDLQVIDEDGDECILTEVEICEASEWRLTNKELLSCQERS